MMLSAVACGKGDVETAKEVTEMSDSGSEADKEEAADKTEDKQLDEENDADETKKNPSEIGDVDLEGLEEVVMADVEGTIAVLTEEYESLLEELSAYEKYVENTDTMEAFYAKVYGETKDVCIRLREYCVTYANVIFESDKSSDEKYEDFELMYECVYEDASDEIYDEIYDGVLDEVYDEIYAGILEDGYENAEYEEWAEVRSNEYDWWSDCRSDVYEEWSDWHSDVYDFWSDMRGEMWDDDEEKVYKKLEDFVEDIEKLKSDSDETAEDKETDKVNTDESEDVEEETEAGDSELVDGMRPEFKEAMDSYEAFYDEYCDILKKYNENPTDLTILSEYTDIMEESLEMSEAFEEWDNGELNDAELKYYLEVSGRVSEMLLEVVG